MNVLVDNETTFRLVFFFAVLASMMLLERITPKRERRISVIQRWTTNLGIIFLNSIIIRLLIPILPIAVAGLAVKNGWGLFNAIDLPILVEIVLSLILLDLVIYLQHVAFHKIPLLWRLHIVHHTDLDLDVTSGNRFHPIEIGLSIVVKFTAIILLGVAPVAVILFEIILNAMAQFNHSNIHIAKPLEKVLNWFLVTPDMHRVHHSVIVKETDSNYGFNIPWWDKLFGTYRAQPLAGHNKMVLGINEHQKESYNIIQLMTLPFTKQ